MTSNGNVHILLADDDDEDQELLKEALLAEASHAEITTVWNGEEALSYLANCAEHALPDIIVLDYKMPIVNGAEFLERLQVERRYASIPKVVWSSSGRQQYVDQCLRHGASLFVTKPNDKAELKNIANRILALCHRPS